MFETLDKIFLAGVGALNMTQEKAEAIFDEYVKRGQVAKENRTGFVKEIIDRADKSRADLEKLVGDQVQKTMNSMGVITKEDLNRLEAKIDALTTMVAECRGGGL